MPRGVLTTRPCPKSLDSVPSGFNDHWHTTGMEPLENPVYASETAPRTSNGFGLTSMILGFVNVFLVLMVTVSFFLMADAMHSANGVTFADYEYLGDAEIQRMYEEDAEALAPTEFYSFSCSLVLSIFVMLLGTIFGFIGLMQSNAPKMASILGLILSLPMLLCCGGCLLLEMLPV